MDLQPLSSFPVHSSPHVTWSLRCFKSNSNLAFIVLDTPEEPYIHWLIIKPCILYDHYLHRGNGGSKLRSFSKRISREVTGMDLNSSLGCRALLLTCVLPPCELHTARGCSAFTHCCLPRAWTARGRHSRSVCGINGQIKERPSDDYFVWRGSL